MTCDLVFGSPPYTNARIYKDSDGSTVRVHDDAWLWAQWMADIYELALEKCRGVVAFVVGGRTRSFSYNGAPHLLVAELLRRRVCIRCPAIYARRGIFGSGGPDYLRTDYEHIVVATNGGKLPWSNPTAMGHPPKYRPGGKPSHYNANGERVKRANYKPPRLANPGNIIHCKVGGGHMGHELAHRNEAAFPETLVEFFIRSFCPPGGLVADPFVGSGTTAAVAKKLGRIGIGCDLRASQCEIARQRLADVRFGESL